MSYETKELNSEDLELITSGAVVVSPEGSMEA